MIECKCDWEGKCANCLHDQGKWCGDSKCSECCEHDELDHGVCMDCGADRFDDLVAAAESACEGDR